MERAIQNMTKAIAEYSYKPGWKFKIYTETDDTIFVMLYAPVKDLITKRRTTITLGELINTGALQTMPQAREMAGDIVPKMIATAEEHEQREWLIHKGKHVFNPHPGLPGYKGLTRHPESLVPMIKVV